jgi:hypothetical protein
MLWRCTRSGVTAPPFLTLALDERSASALGVVLPGEQHPVPNAYEAGWAPEPVCTLWRRKNRMPLSSIEPQLLGRPAHSLVAIPTDLFWLLHKHSKGQTSECVLVSAGGTYSYRCSVCSLVCYTLKVTKISVFFSLHQYNSQFHHKAQVNLILSEAACLYVQ